MGGLVRLHYRGNVMASLQQPGAGLRYVAQGSEQPAWACTDGICMCAHAQEVCLHALVAGTHDDAVLRAVVRKMAPPQALALLTYLRKWVERQAGARAPIAPTSAMRFSMGISSAGAQLCSATLESK